MGIVSISQGSLTILHYNTFEVVISVQGIEQVLIKLWLPNINSEQPCRVAEEHSVSEHTGLQVKKEE